jgi:hypothetical protein
MSTCMHVAGVSVVNILYWLKAICNNIIRQNCLEIVIQISCLYSYKDDLKCRCLLVH